ncbi:MAG: hypothetical protein LAP13_01270 [Acidobacteriia bacterium]|nr:hypothetical protein [Terriglobia bacterium]
MRYVRFFHSLVLLLVLPALLVAQGNPAIRSSVRTTSTAPKVVYFTFGNHMHWVDMAWNWGDQVLPSSAEDMMRLVDTTGARGELNFDGVGYEKLAEQAPRVLERLRDYIRRGQIEVVGASYGQPYGLFVEGESNVRQRIYGVRAVERLFGRRPRTWWEEEFDFFPQLPQILRLSGFHNACLFFQWTWHTPFVPFEKDEAILWEGVDGSKLVAVPRTPLQIHQWPERWAEVLKQPEVRALERPLVVQWLELMPSKDWMCRSELMAPQFREFSQRRDLKVQAVTLSEYLSLFKPQSLRTVQYSLDDVFHGMSIGKNGDRIRRMNRQTEGLILDAETFALVGGMLGRPYAQWDVYPSWDLEEAWRDLLIGEGHDVDECEALCGSVGESYMHQAQVLAQRVLDNNLHHIARHIALPKRDPQNDRLVVVFNSLGHSRRDLVTVPWSGGQSTHIVDTQGKPVPSQLLKAADGSAQLAFVAEDVPSVGYKSYELSDAPVADHASAEATASLITQKDKIVLDDGTISAIIDRYHGTIVSLRRRGDPQDFVDPSRPLLALTARVGETMRNSTEGIESVEPGEQGPVIASAVIRGHLAEGVRFETEVRVIAGLGRLEVHPKLFLDQRLDPTLADSLQHRVVPRLDAPQIYSDYPFAVSVVHPRGVYQKKYPTGDWMTSKQFFEEIKAPFTGLNLVDLEDDHRGLLLVHGGNEGFFGAENGYRQVLSMYDAWDESYWAHTQSMGFAFIPHSGYAHHDRLRAGLDFNRPLLAVISGEQAEKPNLPPSESFLKLDAPNVILSAFYRENDGSPTLRVYEADGRPANVQLVSWGEVATAAKVDLLGDIISRLNPEHESLRLKLRPHEIVTLKLDLIRARKQWRNLDASRQVWVESGKKEQPQNPK